jgi:hypothetical protein
MKPQIQNKKKLTIDKDVRDLVDDYMSRQEWMKTFINPKNKPYYYVRY